MRVDYFDIIVHDNVLGSLILKRILVTFWILPNTVWSRKRNVFMNRGRTFSTENVPPVYHGTYRYTTVHTRIPRYIPLYRGTYVRMHTRVRSQNILKILPARLLTHITTRHTVTVDGHRRIYVHRDLVFECTEPVFVSINA